MPRYTIEDSETGRVLVVEGDSPPTEAEMAELFSSTAQSPEEVQRRVRETPIPEDVMTSTPSPGVRREQPAERVTEGMSGQELGTLGLGGAVANVGRNITNAGTATMRALGMLSPADEERMASRNQFDADLLEEVGDDPNFLRGRFIGGAAAGAAIPGGVAGNIATRVLTGAGAGATGAAVTAAPDENVGRSAAIGAALGATAPFVVNAITRFVRRLGGRIRNPFNEDGTLSDEVLTLLQRNEVSPDDLNVGVRRQLLQDGVLSPEEARRFNLFRDVTGEDPLRAQVTRSRDDFVAQQEGAKTSGLIDERLASQDAALIRSTEEAAGGVEDAFDAGVEIQNSVLRPQIELDNRIQALYGEARASAPDALVEPGKLAKLVENSSGQDRLSGGVVGATRGELLNRGIIDADGNVIGRISVDEAEELRQTMNTFFDSATPRGRSLIRQFKDALDDTVLRAAGRDVFTDARAARREFSQRMERAAVSKFDQSRRSVVQDILENTIEADDIIPRVMSRSVKEADLRQLTEFLRDTGGEPAVQSLKSGVMGHLLNSATRSNALNTQGGRTFNGNQFSESLKRFRSEKLRALFSPAEIRQINRIREVGELRIPVPGSQQGMGPTGLAMRSVAARLLERIPGADVLTALAAQGRGLRSAGRALRPAEEASRALGVVEPLRVSGAAGTIADGTLSQ